jgi:hypothetical protein
MKVAIAVVLSVFLLLPAAAQQVSSFTANYQTGKPTTKDNDVRVMLSVRLYNNTANNMRGATVTLVAPSATNKVYATFAEVSVAPGESLALTQSVTVPLQEYTRWQKGSRPSLAVRYSDANGKPVVAIIPAKALVAGQTL